MGQMLRNSLKSNNEVLKVLANKWPSDQAKTDIITAFNLLADNAKSNDILSERIHAAYIMTEYMKPDVEDIIAIVLADPFKCHSIFRKDFDVFDPDRRNHYLEWTNSAAYASNHDPGWKEAADAKQEGDNKIQWTESLYMDYYIMTRVCDKMKERLIRDMGKRGVPDSLCVQQAYDLAKEAHQWVLRKTGEPYLAHPLCVGRILCNLGVESDVIAAALLHDVVEDSSFDLSRITRGFGTKIAEYVDAVTSVDRAYEDSDNPELFSSTKREKDAATVEKLQLCVEARPEMVFALYIKAADRMHNLQTLGNMTKEKKYAKIGETIQYYMPLFKRFHLNYFVDQLENLIWKTSNEVSYSKISSAYQRRLELSSEIIDGLEDTLSTRFYHELNNYCKQSFISSFSLTVEKEEYTPYWLFKQVKDNEKSTTDLSKAIFSKMIPLCSFNLILDPQDEKGTIEDFTTYVVPLIQKSLVKPQYTIVSASTDKFKRLKITIEDSSRNQFQLFFSTRDSYIQYRMGSKHSIYAPGESSAEDDPYGGKKIRVRLRDGTVRVIDSGASVIDLAFSIHEFIGLSAKAAIIDDQEDQPVSVYTMLQDSNKVEIIADTKKTNGVTVRFVPHARVDWLSAAITKRAKDCLIKYFERRYEGDNPRDETNTCLDNEHFNKYLEEYLIIAESLRTES